MVDAYTKAVLTVIALGFVGMASRPIAGTLAAEAGLDVPDFKAGEKLSKDVPKQWGRFVAATGVEMQTRLWFEASDGTIRSVSGACSACELVRR